MKPERPHNLEDQLSAYLDGELTAAERAEVEAWLARDEHARRTLAELERTAAALGSLPRARAPDELLELITSQVERRELLGIDGRAAGVPRPLVRSVGRWLASAAVIAMAASAGWLTFQRLNAPRKPAGGPGPFAEAPPPRPPAVEEEGKRGPHTEDALRREVAPRRDAEPPDVRPRAINELAIRNEAKKSGEALSPRESPAPMRPDSPVAKTARPLPEKTEAGAALARLDAGDAPAERLRTTSTPAAAPSVTLEPAVTAPAADRPGSQPAKDIVVLARGSDRAFAEPAQRQVTVASASVAKQSDDHSHAVRGEFDGEGIDPRSARADRPAEIRLVYADTAARDAAAAIIEESLRRPSDAAHGSSTDGWVRRADLADAAGHDTVGYTYHRTPAGTGAPPSGETAYIVEGTTAATDYAFRIVRQTASRTRPLNVIVVDARGEMKAGAAAHDEALASGAGLCQQNEKDMPPPVDRAGGRELAAKQSLEVGQRLGIFAGIAPAEGIARQAGRSRDGAVGQSPPSRPSATQGRDGRTFENAAATRPATTPVTRLTIRLETVPPAATRPATAPAKPASAPATTPASQRTP